MSQPPEICADRAAAKLRREFCGALLRHADALRLARRREVLKEQSKEAREYYAEAQHVVEFSPPYHHNSIIVEQS